MWSLLIVAIIVAAPSQCPDLMAELQVRATEHPECGTPALLRWVQDAGRRGLHDCLVEQAAAVGLGIPPAAGGPRGGSPNGVLQTRDPYGVPHSYETEHFVIRWGSDWSPDLKRMAWFGELFEASWDVEIEEMGYPYANGAYKLNVYVGHTGADGIPEVIASDNYTWWDIEWYPMIVIDAVWFEYDDYVGMFPPHEFFHTLQMGFETYLSPDGFDTDTAWYWEATAHWSIHEVLPDNTYHVAFLIPFALYPEYPLTHWSSEPDDPAASRQYGAFVFIRHLTDLVVDRDVVRRSWAEAEQGAMPLETLEWLLYEDGVILREAFFDFTARNATWDHEDRDVYLYWIDIGLEYYDFPPHLPTGVVSGASGEPVAAEEYLPHTYSANYWELQDMPAAIEVDFQGDSGPAYWYAAVAIRDGDDHTRYPLEMDGDTGVLVLDGVPDHDEAWLVVAAIDGLENPGESWGYDFTITEPGGGDDDAGDDDAGDDDTGGDDDSDDVDITPGDDDCSCSAAGSVSGATALPALIALALGRRRRSP